MRKKIWTREITLACFCLVTASAALAQWRPATSTRFYISGLAQSVSVKGDFDGKMILADTEEGFVLPALEGKLGFGIEAGFMNNVYQLGICYQNSGQSGNFEQETFNGSYHMIGLQMKWHMFRMSRVQPYLLLGLNYTWVDIENSSVSSLLEIGNSHYTGAGFLPGLGLTFHINSHVFFSAGADFRLIFLQYVKGVMGTTKNVKDLILEEIHRRSNAFIAAGGLSYTLEIGFVF